jgi:hypothetical protein
MPLSLCTLVALAFKLACWMGSLNPSLDMLGDPRSGNKV